MDISAVSGLYKSTVPTPVQPSSEEDRGFEAVLDSIMNAVDETNTLQNKASAESISFALGESDNVHDVLIAQQKANIALQYTVAVRDRFIESYNTIMNMQI